MVRQLGGETTAKISHPEDHALVRRARQGDPSAVDVLLLRMRFVRQVVLYKNARMGAPLEANELEDVVQDALTAVWSKLGHYQGRGPLEAWLYRFSYIQVCARLRAGQREPDLLEDVCGNGADPLAPRQEDPTRFQFLYEALAELEPATAELIRLKHMESLTFDAIAARTGIPANTAKTRYYRGLRRMRELVRRRRAPCEERMGA